MFDTLLIENGQKYYTNQKKFPLSNYQIKKYVTVGKRISSSFKCAQPEVSSFICLRRYIESKLKNQKFNFAVDEEKIADRIGIASF